MKIYKFISNRIYKNHNNNISHPIIKISTIAIILSLCVMIISSSILNGFQQNITSKITGFGNHIKLGKYSNKIPYSEPIEINPALEKQISNIENIKNIQPFAYKTGMINNKDGHGVIVKGVNKKYDFEFIKKNLISGEILSFSENTNEIIISDFISKKTNSKINEEITILFFDKMPRPRKFKIKGIYKTNLDDIDENFIITDLLSVQKLNKWNENKIAGYEINVNNFNSIDSSLINKIKNITPTIIETKNIKELYPKMFHWLDITKYNFKIIFIIMLFVCIVSIINCLLVIAIDKIKFIGIIKAFGYNNRMINKIFFNISSKFIIKGIIMGNIIGFFVCYIQNKTLIFKLNPETYYMNFVPIKINLKQILMINSLTIIVSLLSILISSIIITKLKTIKLINFN